MAGLTAPALGGLRLSPCEFDAHRLVAGKLGGQSELSYSSSRMPSYCGSGNYCNNQSSRSKVLCCEGEGQFVETNVNPAISKSKQLVSSTALGIVAAGVAYSLFTGPSTLAESLGTLGTLSGQPSPTIAEQAGTRKVGPGSVPENWAGLSDQEDVNWWPVEVSDRAGRGIDDAQLSKGEDEQGGGVHTLLYRGVGAERGAQTALLVPSVDEDEDDDFSIDEVGAAGVGFCPAWQMASLELIVPDGVHEKMLPPGGQWPVSFIPRSGSPLAMADMLLIQNKSPSERNKDFTSGEASSTPVGTTRVGMTEEDPVWEVLIGGCFSL